MDAYWWVMSVLAIIAFIGGESYAAKHRAKQNTLSKWIYDLGQKFPLSIFLMGMFVGGLATHLFWHWCPAGSVSTG
jgi:hypothetical protein